jgi:hypothetical protein
MDAPASAERAARAEPLPSPTRAWVEAGIAVLVVRAAFLLVAYAAAWLLATGEGPLRDGVLDIWNRWDAPLFQRVAEFGYTDPRTDPHATAFFPLLPLLLRGLHATGLSYVAAGMLITTVATLVAAVYLYRLAEEDVGAGAGRRAVLYLALFPTAVFLVAPYSEALFLAGAIPAFYYARRGRWHLVALPAAVAMASRAAGLFVLIGLASELLRGRDFRRGTLARAGAALGAGAAPLVAYGAYLAKVKGNAFQFFVDQREGWLRDFTGPLEAFRRTLQIAGAEGAPTNWIMSWRLERVAAAAGLVVVAVALRKREWGYAAFMGTMLAVLMTSTWYFSIPRMLLSWFPAAIFLASFTSRSQARHDYILALFAPISCLGVVVFTSNAWFH